MCLLAVAYKVWDDSPVFVAANREEAFARPSLPPRAYRETNGMRWFGGLDELAGGTWLGVNQAGLLVGVTNRSDVAPPQDAKSRGLLCRDLLACRDVSEVAARLNAESQHEFAGFNLLAISSRDGFIVEHGRTPRRYRIDPGVHVLTNAGWNREDDPRNQRARREFETMSKSPRDVVGRIHLAQQICSLPGTDDQPALCVPGEERGTVSSSVIALTKTASEAVYEFADGPPATVEFGSYSREFRAMLTSPLELETRVHRINLKGPWEYEAAGGSPRGRVTMPADWQSLFDAAVTRASFRRTFHKPSNLDPNERVFLVLDAVGGTGTIALNGKPAGELTDSDRPQRFDVTDALQPFSELVVDLSVAPGYDGPAGLHGVVALEIESSH